MSQLHQQENVTDITLQTCACEAEIDIDSRRSVRDRVKLFENGAPEPPPIPCISYLPKPARKDSSASSSTSSIHAPLRSRDNEPVYAMVSPPVPAKPKQVLSPESAEEITPRTSLSSDPISSQSVDSRYSTANSRRSVYQPTPFLGLGTAKSSATPRSPNSGRPLSLSSSALPSTCKEYSSSIVSSSSCSGTTTETNSRRSSALVDNCPELVDISSPLYKLQRAALEFFTTEKKYVDELRCLCMLDEKLRVGGYEFSIFKELPCLLRFHEVLLEEIKTVYQSQRYTQIYQPFLAESCAYLKMYKELAHRMTQDLTIYDEKKTAEPRLARMISELLANQEAGKDDSTLLKGVPSRITRYLLLLENLIKYIPQDCEDHEKAVSARDKVKTIVTATNEHLIFISNQEKKFQMMSVVGSVNNPPEPWSTFLKTGTVKKLSKRSEARKEEYRDLYLFSDMLYVKAGNVLKMEMSVIDLNIEEVELISEKQYMLPHRFRICGQEGSIDLAFETAEEMETWRNLIMTAMQDCLGHRRTNESSESSYLKPKAWTKDEAVSMCTDCKRQFTTFFRRHHCRMCGKVICEKCSRFKDDETASKRENRVCCQCLGEFVSPPSATPLHRQTVQSPPAHSNRNPSLPDIRKFGSDSLPRLQVTLESSLTTPIKLYYEKYDQNEWIKEGKFYCRMDPFGALLLFKRPLDPRPKFKVTCLSHMMVDCPVRNRTVGPENDCVLIQHPSQSLNHLFRIKDPKMKAQFLQLLRARMNVE